MNPRRSTPRRLPAFEAMEARVAPSVAGPGLPGAAQASHRVAASATYVAPLHLANGVTPSDPANGVVTLQASRRGAQFKVTGSLTHISNVSAIVLHLTAPGASDQTVAVLLKPGSGSGAIRHRTFQSTLTETSLIGPLNGQPLGQLLIDIQQGHVDVVVQTNNGVDPASATQPGNYQSGELRGTLMPAGRG